MENLEAVKSFIESNKESDEVKSYLQGFATPTLEGVQKFLTESEDGKKFFDSEKDRHFSKGLETWKEKTFPTLLEEEIAKRFPDETEEQKTIRQLKQQIEEGEKQRLIHELKAKAKEMAVEKNLPLSLVDYFIGSSEQEMKDNLEKFEFTWKKEMEARVKETFKQNGHTPGQGSEESLPMTKEQFNSLSYTEKVRLYDENKELYEKLSK